MADPHGVVRVQRDASWRSESLVNHFQLRWSLVAVHRSLMCSSPFLCDQERILWRCRAVVSYSNTYHHPTLSRSLPQAGSFERTDIHERPIFCSAEAAMLRT